jgi:hypothetical protein
MLNGGASCVLAETVGSMAANLCVDREKYVCLGLDIMQTTYGLRRKVMFMAPPGPFTWGKKHRCGRSGSPMRRAAGMHQPPYHGCDRKKGLMKNNTWEALQSFYQASLKNRLASAFWKLPGEEGMQALFGRALRVKASELKPGDTKGFVFAPFDTSREDVVLIQPDFVYEGNSIMGMGGPYPWNTGKTTLPGKVTTKKDFEALVAKGIESIKKGRLEKVVLSRSHFEKLPAGFFSDGIPAKVV